MNRAQLFFIVLFTLSNAHGATSFLRPASFPTTSMDASFIERRDSAAAGYKPFSGRSAYHPIIIESEEQYMTRHAESVRRNDRATMTNTQYCEKYPLDDTTCPQTPTILDETIKIGDRPQTTQTDKPAKTEKPTVTQPTKPAPAPVASAQTVGTSLDGRPVVASQLVHNGPCTPPQRSKVFLNKILTSGQYRQSDPAFEKTMITTFRAEGDCGNHPNDSGGYTCYGISQNNNPEIDVRKITRADAENIAHRKYYAAHGIDKLPDYLRSDVFTFGWASGPVTAVRNLCRVLGIPERNKIDSEIVMAVENYNGDLHNDYVDAMQQYFIKCAEKPKNKVFLTGWMNRVKLTRENSCHYPTTDPIAQ